MDSVLFNSYTNSERNTSNHEMDSSSSIPRWKIPLSKSFSAAFYSDRKIVSPVAEEDSGRRSRDEEDRKEEPEADTVIQILLPCIICNRTFSPEALERHSKVCTKVKLAEKKPTRPKYDSHAMRIKNTRVADFIPPPDPNEPPQFSRSSSFRRSLTSRGSVREKTPAESRSNRSRAVSIPKTLNFQDMSESFGANSSEFGSSEDSAENNQNVPSYARALSPSEDCPYCLRSFGLKAYDRHVNFCKEVWERRQYETQPTPKEIEEARERQEVRTKYRPMKGSNSFSSLRSMSPGKDPVSNFATAALNKLFGGGLKSSSGSSNFRKSNDSLANSCYGDFARSRSLRHPSPARPPSKIPTAMRVNTISNLPAKNKSTERLEDVPSSGYGPGGHYMSNFSRNSKLRSSLGRNFFRNGKRAEPEGLENTSTSHSNSPLIITPMNFYNKGSNPNKTESSNRPTLLNSDPKYDPYEKAAKQLEELLKSQPSHPQRQNTQRKLGLDRALASIMGNTTNPSTQTNKAPPRTSYNQLYSYLREEDPFKNISADEGYWEEILRGKHKDKVIEQTQAKSHQGRRVEENERDLRFTSAPPIRNSDEKRDSSDSSMENFKYRGVSNISSADSAFSR